MKKLFCIIIILFVFLNSSVVYSRTMPKIHMNELADMQMRCYENYDTKSVINAVLATLYDSDYTIQDYDENLGLIRVTKSLKAAYTNKKRVAGWSVALAAATAYTVFSYGATAATMYSPSRRIATEFKDKTVVIDANVYVQQIDKNKVCVKFIPVEKILQNADGFAFYKTVPVRVIRIYNPEPYNEFFNQIERDLNN